MRREEFLCLCWGRLAQVSAVTLITLALAAWARADSIQDFVISVKAENHSERDLGSCAAEATCFFSGTMSVDVTAGFITAIDITFPGLSTFDVLTSQGARDPVHWEFSAVNGAGEGLNFFFTTSPTLASLVGFTGGTVANGGIVSLPGAQFPDLFLVIGGGITPVPEPPSLMLLGTGLVGITGMVRHKLKR